MVANPHPGVGQLLHNAVQAFTNMLKKSCRLENFRGFLQPTHYHTGQNTGHGTGVSVIVLVVVSVVMAVGVPVGLFLTVAVPMIMGLGVAMPMTVVRLVLMGCGPIPVVGHLRPHVRFLGRRRLRAAPATTFKVKIGCREQLLQPGLPAFRAVSEGIGANFLQRIEVMAAGLALVVKNRHLAGP